ncbi:hypothetical protein [Pedobacter sp. FW305-3-2-15-E-R2A2]|uniref:hypothetical protein n=1 Tax=Pedobacter sp. FW305-3-2-15-E-R2A2 TaxID=3140251 RepID=UPI003140137D
MKKLFVYLFLSGLNIVLYFALAIVDVFAEFLFFGSGKSSEKYSFWGSLFFALLQIIILWLLYKKQILLKDKLLLIINIGIVVCLFVISLFIAQAF